MLILIISSSISSDRNIGQCSSGANLFYCVQRSVDCSTREVLSDQSLEGCGEALIGKVRGQELYGIGVVLR